MGVLAENSVLSSCLTFSDTILSHVSFFYEARFGDLLLLDFWLFDLVKLLELSLVVWLFEEMCLLSTWLFVNTCRRMIFPMVK